MIYTVTVIEASRDAEDLLHASPRCVGYFETEIAAVKAIESNDGDIFEGCYDYAVIESYTAGVFVIGKQIQWYKWKDYKGPYLPIETPEVAKKIVNWGIG